MVQILAILVQINIGEDRYKEIFKLPEINDLTTTYFVKLELKDSNGKIVSENFYGFSSKEEVDLSDLIKLKKVDLAITHEFTEEGNEIVAEVRVKNPTNSLAFMNRLMISKDQSGDEVLPTFWSDNFFSLLPGEEKVITARFTKEDLEGMKPVVILDKN